MNDGINTLVTKSLHKSHLRFDTTLDTPSRVVLVLATYREIGYINRRSLMSMYDLTQRQAGALMRDFIQVHASDIQWNKEHAHTTWTNK